MGGDEADTSASQTAASDAPELSQIAGRYQIQMRLGPSNEQRVGRLWRAYDEVLARPVAVLLVPADDPGAADVLANARAAAQLTHSAVVRVYDAGEEAGFAFVVMEFVAGGSLETQLLNAPLEPTNAVDVAADIAAGIAAAHSIGLRGLTLTPRNVLFSATGAPRLVGLGPSPTSTDGEPALEAHPSEGADTAAADANTEAAEVAAARHDTVGLAHLLYAALTARWPGAESASALQAAPVADGHLRTPRQVRGGVPREVDAVVTQALGDDAILRGLAPIRTPGELAAALSTLRTAESEGHPYGADTQPIDSLEPRGGRRQAPHRQAAKHWRRWAIVVAVALVCLAIAGLFFPGTAGYRRFVTGAAQPTSTPSASSTKPAQAKVTGGDIVAAVSEFDPYGDHNDPHVSEAPRAIDGDPTTAWRTQTYRSADLGHLKPGVGLLVDLGSAQTVSAVDLQLVGTGTSVTLFESDAATPPVTEKAMTEVAEQSLAPSNLMLHPAAGSKGRYWLVWLTQLPAVTGGFQGGIAEMTFLH